MYIIDTDQQRIALGEARNHPIEAVHDHRPALSAGSVDLDFAHIGGGSSGDLRNQLEHRERPPGRAP